MNPRSIRFQLTAWFSADLALSLAIFAVFTWFALRELLFHAVDEALADRVEGVRRFMENQVGALSVEEIRDELKEHSVLGPGGDLFQVCDSTGVWLYRSAPLENHDIPIERPASLPAGGRLEDRDVVFGIRAHAAVEDRLADVIMSSWKADETSLLRPLG